MVTCISLPLPLPLSLSSHDSIDLQDAPLDRDEVSTTWIDEEAPNGDDEADERTSTEPMRDNAFDPLRDTLTRARSNDLPWQAMSSRVRLASNKRVPGTRYEIVRWLGEGGMGTVFEAVHLDLGRRVALKILEPSVRASQTQRERFVAEAQKMAAIDSPYVAEVLEIGELSDGRPFYTMELLQPNSLSRQLRESGPMSLERALPILRQCCKALAAVHAENLVHRDVKLGNVLLQRGADGRETVRLVDFGIAAPVGSTPPVAGTAMTMAPEQIRGQDFDGRVDVYALGCVAYELLTGHPPFAGKSLVAVVDAHLHEPPPRASASNPALSKDVDELLATCLAKRAEDRFASMQALEAALCELQIRHGLRTDWDDLPLPEVEGGALEGLRSRMPRPQSLRRHGVRLAAVAVAFVAGVLLTSVSFASNSLTEGTQNRQLPVVSERLDSSLSVKSVEEAQQ